MLRQLLVTNTVIVGYIIRLARTEYSKCIKWGVAAARSLLSPELGHARPQSYEFSGVSCRYLLLSMYYNSIALVLEPDCNRLCA
jgi:hypothetical protein